MLWVGLWITYKEWNDEIRDIDTSSQKEFIAELKNGLEEKSLRLGSLSPVVAYSTVIEGEKKRTQYFSPLEETFGQILRENIIKKYKAIYSENTLEEDSFEVIPIATEKYTIKTLLSMAIMESSFY